jgi:hypothetical protein
VVEDLDVAPNEDKTVASVKARHSKPARQPGLLCSRATRRKRMFLVFLFIGLVLFCLFLSTIDAPPEFLRSRPKKPDLD